jgi:hypothetical protein
MKEPKPLRLFPRRRLCPHEHSLRVLKRALLSVALGSVRSDFKRVEALFLLFPELRTLEHCRSQKPAATDS